jgi:hypothetical protein
MSIAALPPLASEPAAHVTVVPSLVQLKAEPSVCAAPINVVPDGIGTVRRGCDASEGPASWMCMWYVTTLPAVTGSGESLTLVERSADVVTEVVLVALSLALFGSVTSFEALAVFESVDPFARSAATCTTSVKLALAPPARLDPVQLTLPPDPTDGVVQEKPAGALIDLKLVPAGRSSLSATLLAPFGPLFFTPSV